MMFKLKHHKIKGLPEIVDHGEIKDVNQTLSVKHSKNYYFMAMKKHGISLKDILYSIDKDLSITDTLKLGLKLIKIVE